MNQLKPLVCLILTIRITQSFYTSLSEDKIKCFNTTVFKNQKLLIQIETPILQINKKITINVYNAQKNILKQQLKNVTAKYTLPKEVTIVTDAIIQQLSLEYVTCLEYHGNSTGQKGSVMILLSLVTNFNHILNKKQKQKQIKVNDVKLDEIDRLSEKIIQLNQQQIQYHQKYQIKERQTESKILKMKEKIHIYCVFECLIAMISSALHIYFLNKYLNDNCLI